MPTHNVNGSSLYRQRLPQLDSDFFLTEGGIETTLIFQEGLDLPEFAAFDLLRSENGLQALLRYFRSYTGVAQRYGAGIILETPTWRANPHWGRKLGYDRPALA